MSSISIFTIMDSIRTTSLCTTTTADITTTADDYIILDSNHLRLMLENYLL